MAVDQVSTRLVQALTSGALDKSLPREGAQLDGRVLAVNPDDSLKVATRYGVFDANLSNLTTIMSGHGGGKGKLPANLADLIGTTVKLEVGGHSAIDGRLLVRLIAGEDAGATAASPEAEPLAATATEIARRIADEVSQAAARQDGLAPVFAAASRLSQSSGNLPADVDQALAVLAGHAIDGASDLTAEDIRNAVSSSGLFLEAKLARAAAGPGDSGFHLDSLQPLVGQDLKAALFGLKSALEAWITQGPASPAMSSQAEAAEQTATTANLAGATLAASDASAQSTLSIASREAGQFDTEALFAVIRPPPVVQQPASPITGSTATAAFAALAGRPDLLTMAALGEWFQADGQRPADRSGQRRGYGMSTPSQDTSRDSPSASQVSAGPARPPPPRRGSLPQGQAAITLAASPPKDPLDLARDLNARTGNAIARIALGQFASLAEPAIQLSSQKSTAPQAAHPASWLFEVPIRVAGLTSIAQFEMDQIDHGGSGEGGRAWRVQFSLDIQPMGPVHARLVLADHRISVGLWAESGIGAAALHQSILGLRQALEAADFAVDEIHLAAGRPPSGPPARAGGFIDRNA